MACDARGGCVTMTYELFQLYLSSYARYAEIVRDLAWQIVTFAATVDASFLSIASLPEMSECAHGEPSADFENTGRIAESDNRSPPQPPQPCLDRLRSSVTWRGRLLHLQLRRMHPVCQLLAYLRCQNALTE
nr:hypothetical protein [Tanacetum cinerariifolium]